jgi:3-isopropylmalate dehydrogenase
MLRYTFKEEEAAKAIELAVEAVISKGIRTGDIWIDGCKKASTEEMGNAIAENIWRNR